MTQDEIIKMARQAGGMFSELPMMDAWVFDDKNLEAFAKLVAQHEREACAYRAGIALLGADRGLSNRVNQAIKAALETKEESWEKFCDSNCVWTDHHPDCKLAQPQQDGECKYCTDGCPICDARKLPKEAHDLL